MRIGIGHDVHRLRQTDGGGDGGRLMLGGVAVSDEVAAVAHSDGDVLLHALVDALLGAIGDGDIGEHFPPSDERWRDADSGVFVAEAMRRVTAAGYRVGNVDVLVLLERPKLREHKAAIATNVARLVGGPVSVKAGTNEGLDAVGRGEAVVAQAAVLLLDADG